MQLPLRRDHAGSANDLTAIDPPSGLADPGAADAMLSAQPLSEFAYQALLGMLLGGEMQLNEVVTERQIAVRLGISRTPTREAIRRLEGEGLLERQRTGALVVRPLPVDEYVHMLDVRRLLEAEAARLAAGNAPIPALKRLRQRFLEMKELPPDVAMLEIRDCDRDLHALIAQASGNPVLEHTIEALRLRTAMFRFARSDTRRNEVCDEHIAIIDALLAEDATAAQQAMQQHLDQVRSLLLQRLVAR